MQQLKLIIIFILFPMLAWANLGNKNIDIAEIIGEGVSVFDRAVHYRLFSLDNQAITIENIIIGLFALIIGLKAAKYLSVFFKKRLFSFITLDNNSANLLSRIIDYVFMAIIIVIVLDIARVPMTIFTFIGGAFVVSIGLSSQHLVNNFISGIALIIESNIKIGDTIEFEGIIGKVESIEARMVQIKSQNNIEYFIPHSKLMQERFAHWTHHGGRVRISTEFKIDQKDNTDGDFEKIVLNAVAQNRNILTTPKPQLLLLAFENNILCYEVNFWINLANSDRRQVISEVNNRILNALRAHHISLAVPSRKYVK